MVRNTQARVVQIRDQMTHLKRVVMIRDADQVSDDLVCSFEDFLASGSDNSDQVDAAF